MFKIIIYSNNIPKKLRPSTYQSFLDLDITLEKWQPSVHTKTHCDAIHRNGKNEINIKYRTIKFKIQGNNSEFFF